MSVFSATLCSLQTQETQGVVAVAAVQAINAAFADAPVNVPPVP